MSYKKVFLFTLIAWVGVLLVYLHTKTEQWAAKHHPLLSEQPPMELPYKWVGNLAQSKLNEPSGITYHPQRKTLFAVGDEGDLYEMRTDGQLIRSKHLKQSDLEGITVNPATGLLYAVVEGDDAVIEIHPDTFRITRRFEINRNFEGRELLKKGGRGLEAIAFVPDASHPEGGVFWVGNQSFNLKPGHEPSIICEVVLPILSSHKKNAEGTIVRFFQMNVVDISGLCYDPLCDCLLVISDTTNLLIEMTRDGNILRRYLLPGDNQEGIVLDGLGFMYIAQESGEIIKIQDRRIR